MTESLEVKPVELRSLTKYVLRRLDGNKHFCALVTGPTGSGKSYSALAWAEELSKAQGHEFTADSVVFNVEDLLKLLTSGKVPRGGVIIIDEIGIGGNSRKFMSQVNMALNFVFQSVRSYGNPIIIATTPHAGFLDAGVRKLMHAHFECLGVDRRRMKTKVKPLMQQVSQADGTLYRKYLRVRSASGRLLPLKRMGFSMPSPGLTRDYEIKKRRFQDDLYNQLLADIRTDGSEGSEGSSGPRVALTSRQEEFLLNIKGGKNLTECAKAMGTSVGNAGQIKTSLEKRGFSFKPKKTGVQTTGYEVFEPRGGYV